jgi:hypothetical protein
VGLEGHGEAEVVDGVCVEKDEQCVHEWKKRRRMSWFNVPGGARCGVCVTTTILSAVGPGVKRLYALDTPQSKKNVNLLIEIRLFPLPTLFSSSNGIGLWFALFNLRYKMLLARNLESILERTTKHAMVCTVGTNLSSYIAFYITTS